MNTVAIVQARMGSTRLPGKVLKKLVDCSVIVHVINRLKEVSNINRIVVATTTLKQDDCIVEELKKHDVIICRGSEQDVLGRYYESAVKSNAANIIRITADCPLIDPGLVENIVEFFKEKKVDYVSNSLIRTFPRGLDTEVFTMEALERAYKNAKDPVLREHVTPYIYTNPDKFRIKNFINDINFSNYRWTLDTIEDWHLISEIYQRLYEPGKMFYWQEVLHLMENYPELTFINAHIEQKKLGE